jgi:hypothetical protein
VPRHVPPERSHSCWAVAADAGAEAPDVAQPAMLATKSSDPMIIRSAVPPSCASILTVLALPPARHVLGNRSRQFGVQCHELNPGHVAPS